MNAQLTHLGNIWPPFRFYMALLVVIGAALTFAKWGVADCSTETPNTPLNDLGQGTYSNPSPSPGTTPVQGGLYPGGYNQRPTPHNSDGIDIATNQIFLRKMNGDPDPNGTDPNSKIIMISIGMCNALMEFGGGNPNSADPKSFIPRAARDLSLNPRLKIVNCAQAGMDASAWAGPTPSEDPAWMEAIDLVNGPDTSVNQVQVVWLKQAWIFAPGQPGQHWPPEAWPVHAQDLQTDLEQILRNIRKIFPKVRIAYLSPRTYAYTQTFHNPEPKAYETGFAVKWTIQEQIDNPNGTIGYKGNHPAAPWICWGPYLWTNGRMGRSDHLTWECGNAGSPNDVRHMASGGGPDYVHPAASDAMGDDVGLGRKKVADQLFAFFKTDPTATPWFLKKPGPEEVPPTFSPSPTPTAVPMGGSVDFHVSATPGPGRMIKEYVWTFDDGDYAYDPDNPLDADVNKTFPAPSESGTPYQVHVTAIDDIGNAGFATIPVTVTTPTPGPRHGSVKDTKHQAAPVPRPEQGAAQKVATTISKERRR